MVLFTLPKFIKLKVKKNKTKKQNKKEQKQNDYVSSIRTDGQTQGQNVFGAADICVYNIYINIYIYIEDHVTEY